jgi:hypothetical protein
MIIDPHVLQKRYQKISEAFYRLEPFGNIPKDISGEMMDIFARWSDAYEVRYWGQLSVGEANAAKWPQKEQETWNAAIDRSEVLLKQAAASPGVRVVLEQQQGPVGPVVQAQDVQVRGRVPWFWLIGSTAVLIGIGLILSKKERPPRPVLTGFGTRGWRNRK